jgi:hypothetical protein
MNVKQWVGNPVSDHFKILAASKNHAYRGGFEPIPDVVVFSPDVEGDWRRRSHENTLKCMLLAIEVKASERKDGRLTLGEIRGDIKKLVSHRQEVVARGGHMDCCVIIIDSAKESRERMLEEALDVAIQSAKDAEIGLLYVSPDREEFILPLGQAKNDAETVILEVGGEGGSIKLLGKESDEGWAFNVSSEESGLLGDDEDYTPPVRPWVKSWDEAVQQLDQYPWPNLYPLEVHPDFIARVETALKMRVAPDDKGVWPKWSALREVADGDVRQLPFDD